MGDVDGGPFGFRLVTGTVRARFAGGAFSHKAFQGGWSARVGHVPW